MHAATSAQDIITNARNAGKRVERALLKIALREYQKKIKYSLTSQIASPASSPLSKGDSTASPASTSASPIVNSTSKTKRGGTMFKGGKSKRNRTHDWWYTRCTGIFLAVHKGVWENMDDKLTHETVTIGVGRSSIRRWITTHKNNKFVHNWFDIVRDMTSEM